MDAVKTMNNKISVSNIKQQELEDAPIHPKADEIYPYIFYCTINIL